MNKRGWIGCDLDGTLAVYDGWQGADHIGAPVPAMVARVQRARARGIEVRVLTARVCDGLDSTRAAIEDWCLDHVGEILPVTNAKDYGMIEAWDDRAVQVLPNTGEFVGCSQFEPRVVRRFEGYFYDRCDEGGWQVSEERYGDNLLHAALEDISPTGMARVRITVEVLD